MEYGPNLNEPEWIKRMFTDIYGNGKPGLIDEFRTFRTLWTTRDEERKVYEARQERKNNLLIALGMLILAALAYFGLTPNKHQSSLFSQDSSSVYAESQNLSVK